MVSATPDLWVTFPAAEHHRPLTSTKLYCLVTEAHVCEQLAQGRYLVVERPGIVNRPIVKFFAQTLLALLFFCFYCFCCCRFAKCRWT